MIFFGKRLNVKERPLIAVSYDINGWILQRWAKNIKALNEHKYDFLLFSVHHLKKDPQYYIHLLKDVDLIINLLPYLVSEIKDLTDTPIINTVHHWVDDDYMRPFVLASEEIITVSSYWKNSLSEVFGYPADKVSLVHCGIEEQFLKEHPPLFKKKKDKITLGFFAKNSSNQKDRKGIRHFLKLIEELKSQNKLSDFRFILSGAGWHQLVKELNSNGADIKYTKYVNDKKMPRLYKSLDYYLMLSDIEGGPATVLESMACKTCVITTNVGLVLDIGKDNDNCIIVNNSDSSGIINKILYYENNQKDKQRLIDNAYQIASNMTYEKTFEKFGSIIANKLSKHEKTAQARLNIKKIQKFLYKKAPKIK